ncbi:MAG: glycosyltransferase family 2 protein [Niabella sp.]|nr:MAG: glycosyltransferase family 2 protein [Niabella sp.]
MKNNPLVSVVIPTYNRKLLAERLIKSILKSTYKNIEIVVIDDASPDNTIDYLSSKFRNKKNIRIFRNKKNQFAAGSKNVGQSKARGEFIAFIDDDNVVDSKMIEKLVAVFVKNNNVGEAGPINYNFNKKNLILLTRSTRNMWTTKTYHLRTFKPFRSLKEWEADDIPNAFMVRANIVVKNKIKFRSKYGIMYEESDYAYRIRNAGFKVLMVRDAKIYHDIEDSNSKEKNKDYLYHFMEDKRRPFVFARNRVIFHSLYSTPLQKFVIYLFWIWFFTAYYVYKFLFYNGYGNFNFINKLSAAINYIKGTISGFGFALLKTSKI